MQHATQPVQQPPCEPVPPKPDPLHIKLADAMYFIVQSKGVRVPKILEDYWKCDRTTVWRFFHLKGGARRWSEYIRETMAVTTIIVDGHAVRKSLPALALTGKGLGMWHRLGEELRDYLPNSESDPRRIGETEPDATLHGVAPRSNDATSLVATPAVQLVAPVASPSVEAAGTGGISGPEPSAWAAPTGGLIDYLPSVGLVTVEKFCLSAEIADPPAIDMPADWKLSTTVNSKGGGKIEHYERTFGRGWRFQITFKRGVWHMVKVMVRKRKGSAVWGLISETTSTAREYLRDICDMLEMRTYQTMGPTLRISVPSASMRQKLDEAIPSGCFVTVEDRETGDVFDIDKSTNGRFGLAEIEYSSLEDFENAALAGRRALDSDLRSRKLEASLIDVMRDLELQREALIKVAENQGIEAKIIAVNQTRRTLGELDGE